MRQNKNYYKNIQLEHFCPLEANKSSPTKHQIFIKKTEMRHFKILKKEKENYSQLFLFPLIWLLFGFRESYCFIHFQVRFHTKKLLNFQDKKREEKHN